MNRICQCYTYIAIYIAYCNITNVIAQNEILSRKRGTSLTALEKDYNTPGSSPIAAIQLSEEEELFLRYLQQDSSHSFSMAAPSSSPSQRPSARPSALPTSKPSSGPSQWPSNSPTRPPTEGTFPPTPAPVPQVCVDSSATYQKLTPVASTTTSNGAIYKLYDCDWVAEKNTERRCEMEKWKSHCPVACNACDDYQNEDSMNTFYAPDVRKRNCNWIKKQTRSRCKLSKVASVYCQKTCGEGKEDTTSKFFALPSKACDFVAKNKNVRCTFKVAKKRCPKTCGYVCPSGESCVAEDAEDDVTFPIPFKRYNCQNIADMNFNKRKKFCGKKWVNTTCRKTCSEF